MKDKIHNIRDINPQDRAALEHVIGQPLHDDQQIIIRVVDLKPVGQPAISGPGEPLPDWCQVYEGLADDEIDEIETSIIRTRSSRSFE